MLGEVASSEVEYASDHLLQVRNGVLASPEVQHAVPQVRRRSVPRGSERGSGIAGSARFSASSEGTLVFRSGTEGSAQRLVWFDRSGKEIGTVGSPSQYSNPALSPDGTQAAVTIRAQGGPPTRSGRSISRGIWPRGSRSRPETRRTRPGRPTERASPMASLAAGSWTSIKIGRRDRGRDSSSSARTSRTFRAASPRTVAGSASTTDVHGADLGPLRPVAPGFGPFGPGHGHHAVP